MKELQNKLSKLAKYIEKDLPRVVGIEAVNHFKQSFVDEGFTDKALKKWTPALRKSNPRTKGAAKSRKTLTGDTGDLGRSLDYKVKGSKITISSDKVYAQIHNEGGKAGRGRRVSIPQRQFVGPSEALTKKIEDKLTKDIDRIWRL